jgi:hypothetical protein
LGRKNWQKANFENRAPARSGLRQDKLHDFEIPSPHRGETVLHLFVAFGRNAVIVSPAPAIGVHNTIWSLDGSRVFMSGQRSRVMSSADAKTHMLVQTIGPFTNFVLPFTINGTNTGVNISAAQIERRAADPDPAC